MDLVTHALLGAGVAHATRPRRPSLSLRERLSLGGLAAMFPDIDFLGFLIDPLRFIADWHQGPTHSLVLLPLWALLLGGLFVVATGRRGTFAEAALVSGLGLATHIAADVVTAYGTALLYPLSARRFSLATTYVIDPLFTVIVLAGLAAGLRTGRRGASLAGLAVLCLYVAGQAWLQQRAIETGQAAARARSIEFTRLAALPQPLSPFHWKLVGSVDERYFETYLALAEVRIPLPDVPGLRRWSELATAYRPPAGLEWASRHRLGERTELREQIAALWADPRFAPYRRFATYPAVSSVDSEGSETCIWFTDLRYDLPTLPDTFRYGFCRSAGGGDWRLYRLRYFSERERQRLTP